jgi:hypothetical protein
VKRYSVWLAVLAVCTVIASSCTTPSIKAPAAPPAPKQEPITELPAVSTPPEEITGTDEQKEKVLVFRTEPMIIPEETAEPELIDQPELVVQPEQPVLPEQPPPEPPPLQAETPPVVPPAVVTPVPTPPAVVTPAPTPPAVTPPTTVRPTPAPPTAAPPAQTPPAAAPEPESPPPEEQEEPLPPERPSLAIPDMPFQPVNVIPEPGEKDLSYSRTVRAVIGQYIEIPFRGAGWVYLGEFGSRRGVNYNSRRMEPEGMTFIFRAEA